ncbi:hypothetical protein [Legionella hackeliae]|uniref:Uncharacterized protein n=1 Tax=Legionella hackeliae TaxID=449 RepID=A0A0A8UV68_LEGHA|nr:hypothetical protein [Legionella hackeliae]KTD15220.1 hypothetical protein Lhac_0062 [Legionella hackeliae]CEK11416.1 protein of unknown function [Legionella hackeliae]STX48187.1 Uncharacterised protein [Legionella hackeliae]
MRKYNSEEALIFAWQKKLKETETNRKHLKIELLEILAKDTSANLRLTEFQTRRRELLGENHQQGWNWTANFNWLWNFLFVVSFGLFKTNLQTGSRLREALFDTPKPDTQVLTQFEETASSLSLNEKEFEEALFSNPSQAFQDVQFRVQELKIDSSSEQKIDVITRLEAIKLRLPSQVYHSYLKKLFALASPECLTFYYTLYNKNDSPTQHEFIEYYLIADALIKYFVSPNKVITAKETTHPYIFAAQELIIILSASDFNVKPMEKLLFSIGLNKQENSCYEKRETVYLEVKEKILALLAERIESHRFKWTDYNTQIKVVEDLYEYAKPKSHPLLVVVTRMLCEMFIQATYTASEETKKEWLYPNQNYQTLKFFAKQILNSWPATYELGDFEKNSDLLNPYMYGSGVEANYRRAEKFTVDILLHAFIFEDLALTTMRKICCRYKLERMEVEWILGRVGAIYPDLIPKLQSILQDVVFFESQHLTKIPTKIQTDDLIDDIASALTARKNAGIKSENSFNETALCAINKLLNDCPLNTQQLNLIYNEFLLNNFHNYCISETLFQHWKEKIKDRRNELLRVSENEIAITEPELEELRKEDLSIANILTEKSPFMRIKTLCEYVRATCNEEPINFSLATRNYTRLAANNFAALMDTITKENAEQIMDLLKTELQPYLSEELYSSWYKKLLDVENPHMEKTPIAFFNSTPNQHIDNSPKLQGSSLKS